MLNWTDLLIGFVSGAAASGLAALLLDRGARPKLAIDVDRGPRAQGQANGPHEFWHVVVTNVPAPWPIAGRRPAWSCQAQLAVVSETGDHALLGPVPARWPSHPEPIMPVAFRDTIVNVPDIARMIAARRVDVHAHAPQTVAVCLKYEGEPDLHLFTNESYVFPRWANPAWRLAGGQHRLRIMIDFERGRVEQDFWVHNRGPRRDDVSLEKVAG